MLIDTRAFGIWCGIAGAILIGIGLWPLMGFLPAPRPSASALEIATYFRSNANGIIWGAMAMIAAFPMLVPFYAVISEELRRMDAQGSILARAQFGLGVLAVCVPGVVGSVSWLIAAFRPERPDAIIQLLNDFSWILIFSVVVAGLLQTFMIAFAVFNDRSARPSFPRWFGYFNLWIGIAFLPGGLLGLFKTGPFAWNGLFCYWLGLAAFGLWFCVTAWLLLKARRAAA